MADPKWADVESAVAIPFCLLSTELHICISLDCRISSESNSDTRRKDMAVWYSSRRPSIISDLA